MIPIDVAMQHLQAEEDDRQQVERKLLSAIVSAENFMGRKLFASFDELQTAQAKAVLDKKMLNVDDGEIRQRQLAEINKHIRGVVINPAIEIGILLILGDLYANRENSSSVGMSDLPMGARFHLEPYRFLGV